MPNMFPGLHQLLREREQGALGRRDADIFQRSLHFPAHYAGKLKVEHTYQGHSGCVNRLAWNADGSLLVSGSDDRRAIIWHYPDVSRTPLALSTEHRANIFGCCFLPCSGDMRLVTGAMDDTVQLHELDAAPAAQQGWVSGAGRQSTAAAAGGGPALRRRVGSASSHLQLVTPRTRVFYSHKDRVKDVKVEPLNPHAFWSAGEDGVVRQYDTRAPNQDKWESPTVLVQLRDGHKTIQAKSIDICKSQPHLLAVAGSDPFIRLYDRRKLDCHCWRRRGTTPPLLALAPPHLPLAAQARHGRAHSTYVAFSNRGDKVVATYHGDHAYSFDVTSAGSLTATFPQPSSLAPTGAAAFGPSFCSATAATTAAAAARPLNSTPAASSSSSAAAAAAPPLPPRAEEAKARGTSAASEGRWSEAVGAFSDALHWAPGAPLLYVLRAEALLSRAWVGDAALALRDCDTAHQLRPGGCRRAALRRIAALQALQQFRCALAAVEDYRRRFLGRARKEDEDEEDEEDEAGGGGGSCEEVCRLASQLRSASDERRRMYEARRQQQERRRALRAEALARAPRRVASTPPRPQRAAAPRGGGGPAAGPASTSGATAAGATAAGATSATTTVRDALEAPSAGSPAGPQQAVGAAAAPATASPPRAAAAAAAAAAGGAAAADSTAAPAAEAPAERRSQEAATAAASASHLEGSRREGTEDDSSDEVYGPPPPPPPLPPPQEKEGGGEQGAPQSPSSAAGDAMQVDAAAGAAAGTHQQQQRPGQQDGGSAAVPGSAAADSGGREVSGPPEPGQAAAAAGPRAGAEADAAAAAAAGSANGAEAAAAAAGAAADSEQPPRRVARFRLERVWEGGEDEEEGRLVVMPGDGEGEVEAEEEEAEEEAEEGGAGGSGSDSDLDSLPGGEEERDPDEELFLQYYARVFGLTEGEDGSGASTSGRPTGHCRQSGTPAGHPPGAWGGSEGGRRMFQRYVGQCNVQTDIKEVTFVGSDDRLVAAGSDCGRVFLYDSASGEVLRALPADEDVANCVQCHPSLPVLATSGIEDVIRLWSPAGEALPGAAASLEQRREAEGLAGRNQDRMREGPSSIRASALQQALQENPQLWHLLMSQLYGR
ncbi:hypothetical protein Agub_g2104, partial [Astrephomene gubernaculifera]